LLSRRLAFQFEYSEVPILNVGSKEDPAKLKKKGFCINLDISRVADHDGSLLAIDVLACAQKLPFKDDSFKTVVLGDVLEHMTFRYMIEALREAKRVTKEKIIITIPEDKRKREEQHKTKRYGKFVNTNFASAWHIASYNYHVLLCIFENLGLSVGKFEKFIEIAPNVWHYCFVLKKGV